MKKRWFVIKMKRTMSGGSITAVEEWSSVELARKAADCVNSKNTGNIVPDVYFIAELSNDLNLTMHPLYQDKR